MRVKLLLKAGVRQIRISLSNSLRRGRRGFTLVELLAVMAITIDGQDTTFTVTTLGDPPGDPPALETTDLSPVLTVDPSEVSAGDTVTFTVTVTVTVTVNNTGTDLEDLSFVSVGLPPGFSYDDGTTSALPRWTPRKRPWERCPMTHRTSPCLLGTSRPWGPAPRAESR